MTNYNVTILYSQISICSASEPDFPTWTDEHVAQGFAWRPGHVSFGVPDHDGSCLVQVVKTVGLPQDSHNALRIIKVPLDVGTSGTLLATVLDSADLEIGLGKYQLYFLVFSNHDEAVPYR